MTTPTSRSTGSLKTSPRINLRLSSPPSTHVSYLPTSTYPVSHLPMSTPPVPHLPISIPMPHLPTSTPSVSHLPTSIPMPHLPTSTPSVSHVPISIPIPHLPTSIPSVSHLSTSTVPRLPMSTSPVSHLPTSTSPVSHLPMSTSPVSGLPMSTSPVFHLHTSTSPVSHLSTSTSPVSGLPMSTMSHVPVVSQSDFLLSSSLRSRTTRLSSPPQVLISPPHEYTSHLHHSISPPPSSPREARILALKHSALTLRQRIETEKKKLEAKVYLTSPRPVTHSSASSQGDTSTIPGVTNIYQHAATVERERSLNEAAIKIQSTWRGHKVRKSLRSYPVTSISSYHYPSTISSVLTVKRPQVTPILTTPPCTQHVTAPWQHSGGDHLSVINIFTRQQEQLRRTLQEQPMPLQNVPTKNVGGDDDLAHVTYTDTFETGSVTSSASSEDTIEEQREQELDEETEKQQDKDKEQDEGEGLDTTLVSLVEVPPQESSSSSSSEKSQDDISAITPPGSPSFHETFMSPPRAYLPSTTATQVCSCHYLVLLNVILYYFSHNIHLTLLN